MTPLFAVRPHHPTSLLLCALLSLLAGCGGDNSITLLSPQAQSTQASLNIAPEQQNVYSPQISTNSNKQAIVVWRQNTDSRLAVYASIFNNNNWSNSTLIDAQNGQDASLMNSAINANGDAISTWVQWDGSRYHVWANLYNAAANTWGTATKISQQDTGDNLSPRADINDTGQAIVIWSRTNSLTQRSDILIRKFATTWENETSIAQSDAHTSQPQIALNNDNAIIAIWDQLSSGWLSVYSNRFDTNNGWSTASPIEADNSGHSQAPQLRKNNDGIIDAVWSQSDGSKLHIWHNRYTSTSQWGTATRVDTEDTLDATQPQLALDAQGNSIVIWLQNSKGVSSVWSRYYSAANGWSDAVLAENIDETDAYAAKVSFTHQGKAMASWIHNTKNTNDSKVRINYFDPQLNQWDISQALCHPNNHFAYNTQLSQSVNGVLLAWEYAGEQDYDCISNNNTSTNFTNRIQLEWLP